MKFIWTENKRKSDGYDPRIIGKMADLRLTMKEAREPSRLGDGTYITENKQGVLMVVYAVKGTTDDGLPVDFEIVVSLPSAMQEPKNRDLAWVDTNNNKFWRQVMRATSLGSHGTPDFSEMEFFTCRARIATYDSHSEMKMKLEDIGPSVRGIDRRFDDAPF